MRTKHIKVRYFFVLEFYNSNLDGVVQGYVEKVPTDENTADICMKNTDVKTFKYHKMEIDEGHCENYVELILLGRRNRTLTSEKIFS